ncbi:MAG: DUF4268 domain-containing protein [Frankiaceae bacterium]
MVKQRPAVRMPRRTGDSWLSFASGPFGYWALSQIADGRLRVEAYLDCGDRERNKRLLDELAADREAWDARTGLSLCFERLDAKKASRIAVYRQLDLSEGADRVQRRAVVDWAARALVAMLDALNEPLRARAKELRAEAAGRPPEPLAIPAP